MMMDKMTLTSLIGSRICHDLISPLGAISNGIELLEMNGTTMSPELKLIAASVSNASAKIRFFRVAYGNSSVGAILPRAEIQSILNDYFSSSRHIVHWPDELEVERHITRLIFLGILCLENALPYGGQIDVRFNSGRWILSSQSEKLRIDPDCWTLLKGGGQLREFAPSEVQFAVLAEASAQRKPPIEVDIADGHITLKI